MKKAIIITVSAIFLMIAGFLASVPILNDIFAGQVADRLAAMPLPERTRVAEKKSIAAKLWGNGNGMDYFGALLIESELTEDQLEAFYAESGIDCHVARQISQSIEVTDHGSHSFKTKIDSDDFYIVYALGSRDSVLKEIYAELDLRGH